MKAAMQAIWAVAWPLQAPLDGDRGRAHGAWWLATCLVTVIPLTAALHHGLFYGGMCMLNSFGQDYTATVIATWLVRDPSLACALVAMMATYWIPWTR